MAQTREWRDGGDAKCSDSVPLATTVLRLLHISRLSEGSARREEICH